MDGYRICDAPGCGRELPPRRRRFCSDGCRRAARRFERVRETGEMAAMTLRMVRALARRAGADGADFPAVWELLAEAESAAVAAIDALRERGYSWADIAAEAGTSKQNLSQWHKRRTRKAGVNDQFTEGNTDG